MQLHKTAGKKALAKPEGGYVQVSAYIIGLLWWALSEGLVSTRAVRVGLALFEVRIRRAAFVWTEKKAGRGVPVFAPRFSASELATLCGLPEKRVRSALRELQQFGLLAEFSPDAIRFARSLSELALSQEQRSSFSSWFGLLTRRRRVPIPRRVLVLACESSSKALVAVILGVCLRCSWLRPGEGFSFSGRVSCSWLARRFRISLRAVQGGKEHLVGLSWIQRNGNINRFGEAVAINPAWHRLLSVDEGEKSQDQRAGEATSAGTSGTNPAGVEARPGTNPAGLSLTRESLPPGEPKYQRESRPASPADNPGPGIFNSKGGIKNQDPLGGRPPPPRLSAICPEDFREVSRALELFRQAVKCQLMPNASEHSRLLWLAAIERARSVPARNPAGVFLHIVKNKKWDYLSDGHFEAANRRLKAFLNAPPPGAVPFLVPRLSMPVAEAPPPRPSPLASLSKDAQLVRVLGEKLAGRGHVFAALHRHQGWDRERYAAALGELAVTNAV